MFAYGFLKGVNQNRPAQLVEVVESRLREMLRGYVSSIEFNEDFYRTSNPDVAAEVKAGTFRSGREHYIHAGYFEDRFPRPIPVDESWYLKEYPDVAAAVKKGSLMSAAQHFAVEGFREGRLPSANWSLLGRRGE